MKRVRRKQRNRVLALVLSAAVVLTGITVPGEMTYAAEDKIDLMPYTQKNGILAAEDGEGSALISTCLREGQFRHVRGQGIAHYLCIFCPDHLLCRLPAPLVSAVCCSLFVHFILLIYCAYDLYHEEPQRLCRVLCLIYFTGSAFMFCSESISSQGSLSPQRAGCRAAHEMTFR